MPVNNDDVSASTGGVRKINAAEDDENDALAVKRARVDLNDSFYDSDEDEMFSQAIQSSSTPLAAGADKSKQSGTGGLASTPLSGRNSFFESRNMPASMMTPCSSSTPKPYVLSSSATTLKGRPLTRTPVASFSSAKANDDDDSLIQSSKPFFRLAKEVKELTDERDLLKGQNLFLEQSLLDKDKEIQEQTKKITELTQKYTEALDEIRDIQRRTDEEIVQLRTQLQFQTEQRTANTFVGVSETNKGSGLASIPTVDVDSQLLAVQNIPKPAKIRPRLSTSMNKSFLSTIKSSRSSVVGGGNTGEHTTESDGSSDETKSENKENGSTILSCEH